MKTVHPGVQATALLIMTTATNDDPLAGWDPRRRAALESFWQAFKEAGVEDLSAAYLRRGGTPVADGDPGLNARDGFTWCRRVIPGYINYQAPVPSHLTLRTRYPEVVTGKG